MKLFERNIIKFGNFRLKSDIMSPFYFDLRPIISYPKILSELADAYILNMQDLDFNSIAGIPFTGIPIATAISIRGTYPMIHCRTRQKEYGTQKSVEGIYSEGDTVLLIDDTITDGASKLETIDLIKNNQFIIHDVLVFLDRKQGGSVTLKKHGICLHSVCDVFQLLDILKHRGQIDRNTHDRSLRFFKNSAVK